MRQIADVIEDLKAKKIEAQKRSELSSDIGSQFSQANRKFSSSIERAIADALKTIGSQSENVTVAQTRQLAGLISWFAKSSKETSDSVNTLLSFLKEDHERPVNVSVPSVVVPEIKIPEIKVPKIVVPEIKAPEIKVPKIVVPEIKAPDVQVTVPPIKVPKITVPKSEVTVTMERDELPEVIQDLTDMQGNGQIILDYPDRTETLTIDGRIWKTSVVMK